MSSSWWSRHPRTGAVLAFLFGAFCTVLILRFTGLGNFQGPARSDGGRADSAAAASSSKAGETPVILPDVRNGTTLLSEPESDQGGTPPGKTPSPTGVSPASVVDLGAPAAPPSDSTSFASGAVLLLADFDAPAPNNVNGNFGVFTPREDEEVFVCREMPDEIVKHGNKGASMRLVYNVGKSGAFNGFWMKLGPNDYGNDFDASEFKTLSFWVKGDAGVGIPNKVKVELRMDAGLPVARQYFQCGAGEWTKVELPLREFAKYGIDLQRLNEFVLVFENYATKPHTSGAIWIDDIALEK